MCEIIVTSKDTYYTFGFIWSENNAKLRWSDKTFTEGTPYKMKFPEKQHRKKYHKWNKIQLKKTELHYQPRGTTLWVMASTAAFHSDWVHVEHHLSCYFPCKLFIGFFLHQQNKLLSCHVFTRADLTQHKFGWRTISNNDHG